MSTTQIPVFAVCACLILGVCAPLPLSAQSVGDLPPFTNWYENPLAAYPLEMQGKNAFIIPAIAAGLCLWLTDNDADLAQRLTYYGTVGVGFGYFIPYTNVYRGNAGFYYRLREWLAVGAEFSMYHFADAYNNTAGFGLRPMIRWYPVSYENLAFFFESGAGLIYTFDDFPMPTSAVGDESRRGTAINGTPVYGIGAEFALSEGVSGLCTIQHAGITNGNIEGVGRNPGHSSNGILLGLTWTP